MFNFHKNRVLEKLFKIRLGFFHLSTTIAFSTWALEDTWTKITGNTNKIKSRMNHEENYVQCSYFTWLMGMDFLVVLIVWIFYEIYFCKRMMSMNRFYISGFNETFYQPIDLRFGDWSLRTRLQTQYCWSFYGAVIDWFRFDKNHKICQIPYPLISGSLLITMFFCEISLYCTFLW